MRKLVAGLFITLDGVTESPDKWQEHFDEDMGIALDALMTEVDSILLGRVTYDEWKSYWPTSRDEPFAGQINNNPKYVVSRTLDKVEWGKFDNVTLIKGNLAEAITKLKQQPGKTISVAGSPTLVRSLIQDDLLDELILMIHPVVAGKGKRLFNDGSDLKRLKLLSSQATRTGTIIATYTPAKKA
jgi:dihydrofolate reductase